MMITPVRAVKALYSAARLVRDPNQLGEVFKIVDALESPKVVDDIIAGLVADREVAAAFIVRHRFKIDLAELRKLPAGTLGRVFADKMVAAALDPAALPEIPSHDARSFFRAHLYETHDIWHAVTGFGTDVLGEIGLQAFYLAQIRGGLPPLLLSAGFARVALFERHAAVDLMNAIERGWRMGKAAKPLFGVRWDDLWSTPIDEVRRRFGIEDAATESGSAALAA